MSILFLKSGQGVFKIDVTWHTIEFFEIKIEIKLEIKLELNSKLNSN
jgi:hypothetical protein